MDHFVVRNQETYCEDVPLSLIAREIGTPCYIYSRATLRRHGQRIREAFSSYPTLACYAVKANSNLSILREIFSMGFGADIVSLGELERSLRAGIDPRKVVYSGVGKKRDELRAALSQGIYAFNLESFFELDLMASVAEELGKTASVSLRVNPNIDARTNPKITTGLFSTKFGVVEAEARAMAERVRQSPNLRLIGVGCHIGSQITEVQPMAEAARRLADFATGLQSLGHKLEFINMGGGLGIRYQAEQPPQPEQYAEALLGAVRSTGLRLLIEPGRVVVGNIGILLSSVIGTKQTPEKSFLIVDGAMNDLIRPSMYDSFHEICTVREGSALKRRVDIVGPICETADYFGKDRDLPIDLVEGDLIYLRSAGAYGSSMSSNYNSRPRVPEVLVDGTSFNTIRRRETLEDLWALEL